MGYSCISSIYIYKTEAFEAPIIFHVITILKKKKKNQPKNVINWILKGFPFHDGLPSLPCLPLPCLPCFLHWALPQIIESPPSSSEY